MNNSENIQQTNGINEEEASSSSNIANADDNANVSNNSTNVDRSKGAIPKTKPLKPNVQKNTQKLNNNLEEMHTLNGATPKTNRYASNGFAACESYLDAYKSPLNATSSCNGEVLDLNIDYSSFSFVQKHDSDSSEDTELLSMSDDGCIYTYKGDNAADLPESFFNLDIVPVDRNEPIPDRIENSSPEMDFLEMDFDPGQSGDVDSDSVSNVETEEANAPPEASNSDKKLESTKHSASKLPNLSNNLSHSSVNLPVNSLDLPLNSVNLPIHSVNLPVHSVNLPFISVDLPVNSVNLPAHSVNLPVDSVDLPSESPPNSANSQSVPMLSNLDMPVASGSGLANARCDSAIKSKTKFIECLKMPWSCVLSQRTVGSSGLRKVRRTHNMSGELVSPVDQKDQIAVSPASPTSEPINGVAQPSPAEDVPEKPLAEIKKVMIWSEQEAESMQVTQIGASACGATAVLNVLNALRLPLPPKEKLQEIMNTRLRANSSPLVEYLMSRSVAGTTHKDIIRGLDKLTDGRVYARHFPMHPEPLLNLPKWLAFWLERGAIPVATLNLQRNVRPVPDAWHHQMVFGVGPEGVYLTNPLECVEPELLWPQLCSESVLMVKREDVLARWTPQEFEKLMTVGDIRWRRLNVVGQVAKVVREGHREMRPGFTNTSHIKIPAAYSSGITLAIDRNSPAFSLLSQCPELPLLHPNDAASAL